jgi:RNA polymerase sigma factor (TIGR02999 family)
MGPRFLVLFFLSRRQLTMSDKRRSASEVGERRALAPEELVPLVYDELRRLAAQRLAREAPGQTLSPTALVNEAYLRLVDVRTPTQWDNPGHFFAAAAEAMRRILVEAARRKASAKRGGNGSRIDLDVNYISIKDASLDMVALSDALDRLAQDRPVHAELVKLRYFAGLTGEQAARALNLSTTTADRYWTYAKSRLRVELE